MLYPHCGSLHRMDAQIQEAIKFFCEELSDYFDESDFDWDVEHQEATVYFRESDSEVVYSKAEFLSMPDEYKTMDAIEDGWVRTPRRTFRLISPFTDTIHLIDANPAKLTMQLGEGVTFHYRPKHFLVALAAIKLGAHEKDFFPPDSYSSVEIYYPENVDKLSAEEEEKALESFLFELAASGDLFFKKNEFTLDFSWYDELLESEAEFAPKFRPLEPFSEGMRLFNSAVQVTDEELRLLSLFKVLEFFGPIALSLESNEAMRKKLDSPLALSPDANYLQSIFDLARKLEKTRNDNDMIRLVIEKCMDFVELSTKLPHPRFRELKYEDKKQEIDAQIRSAAESLVSTRNQVAHAKSDYKPVGNEIPRMELPQFNEFLRAAAVQAIRWYNRLPDHLKLKF
jgi:hypothetical protein